MASPFPEGNAAKATDNEQRSYQKWNSILYEALGDKGPTWKPEGSQPKPTDSPKDSLHKIVTLLN